MYSKHNEWKSVAVEKIIRTLKCRIFMYMTPILKKCVYW